MSEESWRFAHINDHHLGTARSYRFRPAINRRWAAIKQQIAATDADLLLVGGDLTRDGDTHEFEYQQARQDLDELPLPSFVIPGNMDVGNKHTHREGPRDDRRDVDLNMTSHRLALFASYFGPIQWTFMHRGVRFSGFYAAAAGSGLPEEERFWRFMEHLSELPPARLHVAMMHYWPYIDDPDEPTWDITDADQYLPWYFSIDQPHRGRLLEGLQAAGVTDLLCGHVHTGRPVEQVGEMRIHKASAAGNTAQMTNRWEEIETRQGFQLCEVGADEITVSFVAGDEQCEEETGGWGPGGHPRLEERDYSLAREHPPLAPDPWLIGEGEAPGTQL
ncbi:MAG: metallophosphoesterase [Armatimonadota bacterium]|nr:metallophosphoesterase [Armatimonadota bacterium]